MNSFLSECGLSQSIDKFLEHEIEMKDLENLTESEIQELLPKIGDRHKLKNAIKRKYLNQDVDDVSSIQRKRTNINTLADESSHTFSRDKRNKTVKERKRVKKNDATKDEYIISILKTDEALKAELTEKAQKAITAHFEANPQHCRSVPGWALIDFDKGKLNCPLCSTQIKPMFRKTSTSNWTVDNFKRHFVLKHASDDESHNSVDHDESHDSVDIRNCYIALEMLEIVMGTEESIVDAVRCVVENHVVEEVGDEEVGIVGDDERVESAKVLDAVRCVDENHVVEELGDEEVGIVGDYEHVESAKGFSSSVIEKTPFLSHNKRKTDRPQKNKANEKQFIHYKHRLHALMHPTSKELLHINTVSCFLMRSWKKQYRQRKSLSAASTTSTTQFSTLRPSLGLTIAEHDPKTEKTARIASILREIIEEIIFCLDKNGQHLLTKVNPPMKQKCPEYYEKIKKPIDLSLIGSNVESGKYKLPGSFDEDVLRLFSNAVEFYGFTSAEGVAAQELLMFYTAKKENVHQRLLNIIGDSMVLKSFLPENPNRPLLNADPNEDIIRCICGLFREDGIMVQCAKCLLWQHVECTSADVNADNYFCERCDNRTVENEIPLNEYTDEGYRCYLTLMRGDLQVHQTDTVYVLRDIPITPGPESISTSPVRKHTYKTIGKIEYTECDIFRVERLWKDNDGNRFVFGHHYLRPHETYHEPTRKFYQNEIVRVPLSEVVSIDVVMGRCWVLDPITFCKGRPVDSVELHVYICQLRVDKTARHFSKISKYKYPVCTKSYAFNKFVQKLKISRNYSPHHVVNSSLPKPKKNKNEEQSNTCGKSTTIVQSVPIQQKTLKEKRNKLEICLKKLRDIAV